MRLFFIEWYGKDLGMIDVVRELKNQLHEIVYWSGYQLDSELDKKEFPNTIFHEYKDAIAGIAAPGVDDSNFPPPSESLIKSMFETESVLLIMMNKHYEWMGENQKKHLYYHFLQYWDGVIKKYKPDAIVGPSAPHSIYDLVLFDLAKMYRIKTVIFEQSRINNRTILLGDYKQGSAVIKKQLEIDSKKKYSISDLEPDIRSYYDKQMGSYGDPSPEASRAFFKSRFSFKNLVIAKSTVLFRSIKDKVFLERIGNKFLRFGKGNLKKEHQKFQTKIDFSKKYIYVPLHYQPECTTSPLGGIFVDQILMIEILSFCLPKGWLIYVKEHPIQWKPRGVVYFAYRYKGYYERITRLKNVFLAPIKTDTYKLIKNSQAVASVGGTPVWEGLFRGKPGIVFGYAWYIDCPGVFKVRDAMMCKEAIEKIKNGYEVDHQKLINYLGSFQKTALNAFRDFFNKDISSIGVEQNIKNHVDIIMKELKKV